MPLGAEVTVRLLTSVLSADVHGVGLLEKQLFLVWRLLCFCLCLYPSFWYGVGCSLLQIAEGAIEVIAGQTLKVKPP